jgi:hypothetical protein
MFLLNVSKSLADYTASYTRRGVIFVVCLRRCGEDAEKGVSHNQQRQSPEPLKTVPEIWVQIILHGHDTCVNRPPVYPDRRVKRTFSSQSHITTDNQLASPSWCQAPIWDPRPIFLSPSDFLLDSYCLLFCSALSDERTGPVIYCCCWSRQRSHAPLSDQRSGLSFVSMSTRILAGCKARPARKADLTAICEPTV